MFLHINVALFCSIDGEGEPVLHPATKARREGKRSRVKDRMAAQPDKAG